MLEKKFDLNRFDDNLLSFMEKNTVADKKDKCFNYFGKWWSYEDTYNKSYKLVKYLVKAGFKKGDKITVSLVGFPQSIFLIFAASYLGLEMYMWDVRNNAESFRKICERVKPKAVFACEWDNRFIQRMCKEYPDVMFYVLSPLECFSKVTATLRLWMFGFVGKLIPLSKNVKNWRVLEKSDISDVKLPEPAKSTRMYFPTSGSTGQSKYVILSAKHFNSQLYTYELYFKQGNFHPFDKTDSFMNFIPVFAATGLLMILTSMDVGVKQYIYPIPDIEKVWKQIFSHKCSYVFGPTKFYEEMTKFEWAKNIKDMSYIRFLGVGGDKLTPEKEKEFNKFFNDRGSDVKMSNGYGMTEMTAPIAIQNGFDYVPGNCGFPLDRHTIKILNQETLKECKEGEQGEIYVDALSKMEGYLRYDEKGESYIEEPGKLLKTGDLGYMKDGQLYVEGRISRMVTMKNGCKFLSENYERMINSLDFVNDCAVICDNDADKTSDIMLFLNFVKDNNIKEDTQKTLKFIKKNMNPFEYPTHVYLVNEFPMLSSSKKDYNNLMKLAREGKFKVLKKGDK